KYLAGHSDTILGIAVTRDPETAERLRFLQNAMGAVPGPFDCFLALRGLRTLHLRVQRSSESAAAIARFLAGRPDIRGVSYPGLAARTASSAANATPPVSAGPSRHRPVTPAALAWSS